LSKNSIQMLHPWQRDRMNENKEHASMMQGNIPAVLVIDMVKDYFDPRRKLKITPFARAIVGPIRELTMTFRERGWPVIFATDAFKEDDFIFTGRMKPDSLKGTEGAEVIDELERKPEDLWLPKPRFSAFFQTGLERYLRERNVALCAVTGIATPVCILTTALDAICYDFRCVIVSDCTAAASMKVHHDILEVYRKSALFPLLKVCTASVLRADLGVLSKGEHL
jgi:nicotinamidase/pyrazinamidase